MIGTSLAHYEIEEKIGAGGMGEVYRASDPKLKRNVAIKVLPDHLAGDAERMVRFKKEAQLLASLNHPNIGAIYGLEETKGVHALVLELIDGQTLHERIQPGPLPVEEAARIAHQIACALESAHEQRVIHRDLKPANVKITPDGVAKVLDFGLAKAIEEEVSETSLSQSPTFTVAGTRDGTIFGTAPYMSPEQARGKVLDRRTDIWSFGVVLFEMLTGRPLFTGETVSDTLASILKTEPEWDRLASDTPTAIRHLLQRCLDRDPTTRLRDIGEARITLERFISGDVEEATPVPSTERQGDRRRAIGLAAGALLIAAAAAFLGTQLVSKGEELPLRKFEIPVSDINTSLSNGTTMALSPDGTTLAYTSDGLLWIRDFRELEPRPLAGTEGASMPFWSPDGEWIAFGSARKLQKIRVAGGQVAALCEVPSAFSPAAGGVWTEDDRLIFCTGSEGILEVSAQGGDYKTLLEPDPEGEDDFHNVIDLEGKGYAFVVHKKVGGYDELGLLSNGERKTIIQHDDQNLSWPSYSPTGHIIYHREPTNAGIWALPFSISKLEATGDPFLIAPDATLPASSSDGTMAFVSGSTASVGQFVWMDRSGQVLGPIGEPAELSPYPSISPDGRFVALNITEGDNSDLWILDTERATRTRFTFADEGQFDASWSPDSKHIFYASGDDAASIRLMAKLADGTGEPTPITTGFFGTPSPKGDVLVYAKLGDDTRTDLMYLSLEDGIPDTSRAEPQVFLRTDAGETSPVVSPDGRFIAYRSSESGRSEIYIRSFPSGSGKWQVSTNGGFWPEWRGDGRELFYVERDKIMAVDVATQPSLRLGTPKLLFERDPSDLPTPFSWPDGYAVTADGQRFVIAQGAGPIEATARVEGITVVQNWFSEFEGRK